MKTMLLAAVAVLGLSASANAGDFHQGPGGIYYTDSQGMGAGYWHVDVFQIKNSGAQHVWGYDVACSPQGANGYFVKNDDNGNLNYIDPNAGNINGGKAKYYDNMWHYVCNGVPYAND